MLKKHLILTWRLFKKYPLNTAITLSGLALGLAGFMLLSLYVYEEHQADRFHAHYEDIYQVNMTHTVNGKPMFTFPPPAGLKNDLDKLPEVVNSTRALKARDVIVQIDEERFYEKGGFFVDSAWLEIFDFQYLNKNFDFVANPGKIAISQKLADKYYRDVNPIGEVINIDGESYIIENIILPPKGSSSLNPSFLITYKKQQQFGIELDDYTRGHTPYWVLAPHADPLVLEKKLQAIIDEKISPEEKIDITPLKDYYFSGSTYYSTQKATLRGNKKFYHIFSWVSLVVLVLAVINYINLNTARATDRAKEVGIKKTIGARQGGLIMQFLFESIVVTFIAGLLAVGILELFIPSFNSLLVRPINHHVLLTPVFIGGLVGLLFIIGFLSGLYPAFVLSAFKPSWVLKGRVETRGGNNWIRNSLTAIQFTIATLLLFSCFVIKEQMTFLSDFDLGVDSEHIISIRTSDEVKQSLAGLKADLLSIPGVAKVSTGDLPGIGWMYGDEINGETVNIAIHHVDEDFLATSGISLLEGRNFVQGDSENKVIFNKTMRDLHFGEKETTLGQLKENQYLIGVVEDFQLKSAANKVMPLEIKLKPEESRNVMVKIEEGVNTREMLSQLQTTFDKHAPNSVFEYNFLDDEYDSQFKSEMLFLQLLNYFTYLSVFIGFIGLFGLAQFAFLKKTKELGIRKVLGAPLVSIFKLMISELFKPIIVAVFIGLPIGYYLLSQMLQSYANKIELTWQFGLITVGVIVLIGIIAIIYQLLSAAKLRPIKVLREE